MLTCEGSWEFSAIGLKSYLNTLKLVDLDYCLLICIIDIFIKRHLGMRTLHSKFKCVPCSHIARPLFLNFIFYATEQMRHDLMP